MGTWNWVQPGDKTYKVISNYKKGTICVYDECGKLIMEKTGLTKGAIKIIEKNFLDIVVNNEKNKHMKENNDPMYI